MWAISKNNKHQIQAAPWAPRDQGVTPWESGIEIVTGLLDKAAILGLISYAGAIAMRIAEIV